MGSVYDFIIVGGGAAGCALAARLATGLPNYSVLLIEAGGQNEDLSQRKFGERTWTLTAPGYNWGYKTVRQEGLNERELDYSRGKGLGGSTAINFCVYTRGPRADYDRWANLVGDNSWSWEKSKERFKRIESFRRPGPDCQDFLEASSAHHGSEGPIEVGAPEIWDPILGDLLTKAYHCYPKNLDHNSGNPIGVGVCQISSHEENRVTASGAYLDHALKNLTTITNATIAKVVFDGKTAIGVEGDGKKFFTRKEVILSGGSIDSPKLLLLSGIGPANDMKYHNIPLVQDLPGVGKNLKDRLFLELAMVQKPESQYRTSYIDSPGAFELARKEWSESRTGALSDFYLPQMIGYLKSDKIIASQELQNLDATTRDSLQMDTQPHYEIISQNPSRSVTAPEKCLSIAVAFNSTHGASSLTLQSNNPQAPPLIDPKFLTHPFDKRVAIEAVRETMDFFKTPVMAEDSVRQVAGPAGDGDEDILAYVREASRSMWHACGTVKIGKVGEEGTCVDSDCRVVGVRNLRVVDMSVAPFLPSAHLQAVAYLVGETAAEKLVNEYA